MLKQVCEQNVCRMWAFCEKYVKELENGMEDIPEFELYEKNMTE